MNITVTEETLPSNFKEAVQMLSRPYIQITSDQHRDIEEKMKGHGDILIYRGRRMTWGNADGGYALMPLSADNQI